MRSPRIIRNGATHSTEQQRRKCYRKSMNILGEVGLTEQAPRLSCKIVDMSATGARLSLRRNDCLSHNGATCLATRLELFLDKRGSNVQCKVVWQSGEQVGVRFCSPIFNARA